ncbi:MAG TPA: RnfABCDGE type electron transport complex subunit D [Candidatus Onthomonas avicola]|nr:RnfABCDGE type electron transport complex subunit D [Candidatus Onthomonas avicola]
MNGLLNVSSSPHVRSRLTTGQVMYDVILALMPATFFGVYHFGLHAFLVLAVSVLSAVITEFVFDYLTHRPNTLRDGSAIVTGLLLGLCLSPTVPLYIPYLGSLFAVLVAKCLFGGLGHNFMNPALAGRCFLLISFGSAMTSFSVDGVSSATPLAVLRDGGTVDILEMFLGFTNGTIGVSIAALLIGGIYLLITGGITFHIPLAYLLSFCAAMAYLGGQGLDPLFLLAHLCGGGVIMGAFFMATDPVTSPITGRGQVIYGVVVGLLSAIFRVYGSAADSVSYAIILGNLVVPLIDRISVPAPFGLGDNAKKPKPKVPKAAVILTVITLIAGIALGGVNALTADTIAQRALEESAASYAAVLPEAEEFSYDDTLSGVVESYAETGYGDGAYGNITINEVVVGQDSGGNVAGYAISVTSGDGYDGTITLSVGISSDGVVQGISFTELHETAGMGMRADEDEFKGQFTGVQTDSFTLVPGGGSTAENEIDGISGATVTSAAVVNAVNAALDFYANQIS